MMYPRLFLAGNLLTDGGVIFVHNDQLRTSTVLQMKGSGVEIKTI